MSGFGVSFSFLSLRPAAGAGEIPWSPSSPQAVFPGLHGPIKALHPGLVLCPDLLVTSAGGEELQGGLAWVGLSWGENK